MFSPVLAQDSATNDDDAVEEIVVKGYRGSLLQSIEAKRSAEKIVDVITAEDIGKFPEANLAESLQRITGVQITRNRGEGRTASIRGMPSDFTLTNFNGRTLASGVTSPETNTVPRSFDFTVLSSDFVRAVEVYKSPSADQAEGGLSGTINLRTPRALDLGDRVFSLSLNRTNEDNADADGSQISAMYSDVFADDRLGITLGASYTERKLETHRVINAYTISNESADKDYNGDGVIDPALRVLHQGNFITQKIPETRDRLNVLAAMEYQINDNTDWYVEGLFTELETHTERLVNFHRFFNIQGAVDSSRTTATTLSVMDGSGAFRDLPFAEVFAATGVDQRNGSRTADVLAESTSLATGFNFDSEVWSIAGEIAVSDSEQERSYLNIAAAAFGGLGGTGGMMIDNTVREVPVISYFNGYDISRMDPDNFRPFSLNGEFNRQSRDEVFESKLDFEMQLDSERWTSVEFGTRYSSRSFFLDNGRLVVGGAGINDLLGGLLQPSVALPGQLNLAPYMQLVDFGSDGFSSYSGTFPRRYLSSNTKDFLELFTDEELAAAGNVTNAPTNIFDIEEDTIALYAKVNFLARNGDISGDFGLRVIRTDQSSRGVASDLTEIVVEPEAGNVTTVPPGADITVSRDYIDVLPSFNARWDLDDERVLRLAVNRTMSRPTLNLLTPTTSVNGVTFVVSARNPHLDPFRSDNLDLSFEWYFDDSALFAATAFYKNLDSLVSTSSHQEDLPIILLASDGTRTTENRTFTFNTFENASGVTVQGLELSYQQNFGTLPGLLANTGLLANYTFVDNSDPELLTGASENNYNLTAFYEDERVSARLAYTYRDNFISGALGPDNLGLEKQSYGTLDGSISLNIGEHANVYLQASNLTDQAVIETTRIGHLMREYQDNGRRFVLGTRFVF